MRNTAFVFIFLCLAFGAGAGTGPAVTFKQLYDEWERLAGDSAVSDSALKEAMNDTLLSAPHPDSGRADSADTTTRKLLLLIGDSMADCLSWTLTKYCVLLGYDLKTVCFVASTTDKWDNHRFMARLVKKHKPDFVMLCLGSNEFFLHPKKIRGRAPYIKDIIDQADTVPLVWIGPPLLGETRTFDTVISDIIGPDRYFPSSGLVLDRQADNRHPSIRASWIWADTVARWIEHSSRYLLAMVPAGKPARCSQASRLPTRRNRWSAA